ncbi:MAG: KilA-N domain-containing protein, partial [Brevinema sp.]
MNIIQKDNMSLMQREDGYVNATALCKQAGKLIGGYLRNSETQAFLKELAENLGIPVKPCDSADMRNCITGKYQALLEIKTGGNGDQGTYVPPKVAIHLGQWLSPKFAVFVANVVFDFMDGAVQEEPIKIDPQKALKRHHEITKEIAELAEQIAANQAEV